METETNLGTQKDQSACKVDKSCSLNLLTYNFGYNGMIESFHLRIMMEVFPGTLKSKRYNQ